MYLTEVPSPTVDEIGARSVTFSLDEPLPLLTGAPQREITQFAVTFTPQDGGPPVTMYFPAEEGTPFTADGLSPETAYDVEVGVVIDTEGQGEETYDLGIPPLTIETGIYLMYIMVDCLTWTEVMTR